jgi:tetratricopeptide (TPR) repeat protein
MTAGHTGVPIRQSRAISAAIFSLALLLTACGGQLPLPAERLSPAELSARWQKENHDGLGALEKGDAENAERLFRGALKLTEQLPASDLRRAATLNNLASALEQQGKLPEAENLYKQASSAFAASAGADHPGLVTLAKNLARVQKAQNKYAEATQSYKQILNIQEKTIGIQHAEFAVSLTALADLYAKQEKYTLADPLYRRALAIEVKALGRDNQQTLELLEKYAGFLRLMHRPGEASRLEALAESIRKEKK